MLAKSSTRLSSEPGLRPQAPGGSPNRRGLVPGHYRLEPPYCAASLVARAAILLRLAMGHEAEQHHRRAPESFGLPLCLVLRGMARADSARVTGESGACGLILKGPTVVPSDGGLVLLEHRCDHQTWPREPPLDGSFCCERDIVSSSCAVRSEKRAWIATGIFRSGSRPAPRLRAIANPACAATNAASANLAQRACSSRPWHCLAMATHAACRRIYSSARMV
jgi:hypothetical protein